jgi:hypothetical protein
MKKFLGLWLPVVLFAVLSGVPAEGNSLENWFLMSRHGECAEIESLQRKVPELGTINNPDDFLKLMKKQGHEVEVKNLQEAGGNAVEISVPEKELYLIFVKEVLCSGKLKE